MKSSKRSCCCRKLNAAGLVVSVLEREMHAFMTAVLLRLTGLDALDADAQAQPPDGEPGQAEQRPGCGERRAVVGADRGRQAEVLEGALEDGEGELRLGRLEAFAGEQVAGAVIGDGQRVAVLLVAEHELALVVGAPESVGRVGGGQWRAASLVAPAFSALDEAVAIERGVDRAHRRRRDHRVLADQLVADLRRAPGRVLLLDAEDRPLDLKRQLVGLPIRGLAAIVEPVEAAFLVAIEDLVAGDPGDAELAAHWRHLLAFQQAGYEAEAFIHRFTLVPGHLGAPPNAEMCKPCARNASASYLSISSSTAYTSRSQDSRLLSLVQQDLGSVEQVSRRHECRAVHQNWLVLELFIDMFSKAFLKLRREELPPLPPL